MPFDFEKEFIIQKQIERLQKQIERLQNSMPDSPHLTLEDDNDRIDIAFNSNNTSFLFGEYNMLHHISINNLLKLARKILKVYE